MGALKGSTMDLEEPNKILKIMGIDPSFNNFGFFFGNLDLNTGFLENPNVFLSQLPEKKTTKIVRQNSYDLQCARFHTNNLNTFIGFNKPDVICVELPVGSQTARAMASYGVCIGVISGITIPLIQVTPLEVKFAATGDKQATKSDMTKWAVEQHPDAAWLKHGGKITSKNEHIADALGAIYAGVKTDQFKLITSLRK